MNPLVLGLGSNMGNRMKNLEEARKQISLSICEIIEASSIYETEPWGYKDIIWFYNQVIRCQTSLTPEEVMQSILIIEEKMGRKRHNKKYAPRIIDIDILFYADQIIDAVNLTVPHPQIENRKFVLVPLDQILSDYIHPKLNEPVWKILKECKNDQVVKRIN